MLNFSIKIRGRLHLMLEEANHQERAPLEDIRHHSAVR